MNIHIKKDNIEWLTILRTINIILVVMFHIHLVDMTTGDNHSFCLTVTYPFNPIRMPLFIFISGGLLYVSRIQKNWNVLSLYKDKFIRIMIPFFFFVTIYFLFKAMLNGYVKTPVNISFSYYLESFVIYHNHSSAPLWFLATLMQLMLCYPIFRYACKNRVFMIILFILAMCAYFCDISTLFDNNYFNYSDINFCFMFFYFGVIFFRYSLYKYLNNVFFCFSLILLYTILFYLDINLITSLVGIMAIVSIVVCFSKYLSIDVSYIGNHIYQIYLMSFIFQAFVELLLWKKLFYNENLFLLFYIINLSFGIFMPLLVTKIIEKCPYKFVRFCFGLK